MPRTAKPNAEPEAVVDMDAPSPAAEDDTPMDAVIVIKTTADDGTIKTQVMTNGTVQATEVQTLLELGLKGWRERLGLVG